MIINLTKNKKTIVDMLDKHLKDYKWFYCDGYAKRASPRQMKEQKHVFMHHAIIGYPINGMQVDHINGNRLDNRRENLRFVTRRMNTQNKKCHRDGSKSSKYLGVWWNKRIKKWHSAVTINRKRKHLGYFKNEEDAFNAYKSYLTVEVL